MTQQPTRTPPRGRLGRLWRRAAPSRRLGATLLGLVAATALVVGLGAAGRPDYVTTPPRDGVRGDELRHEPVAASWTLAPADVGVPAAQASCLTWQAEPAVASARLDGDVIVSVSGDGSTLSTGCSSVTRFGGGFGSDGATEAVSRLARVDPDDGRVRWWLDLGAELGAGNGYVQLWPADESTGTALVSSLGFGDVGFSAAYGRLDLTSGEVRDVTTSRSGRARLTEATASFALVSSDPEYSFEGSTIYYDAEPGTGSYSLYRTDDPDTAVWTGRSDGRQDEALVDDGLLLLADGALTHVDGTTGEVSPWGPDLSTAATVSVEDGLVLVGLDQAVPTSSDTTDGTVVALSAEGRELWRHGYRQDRGVQAVGRCIVFSTTPGVTCVDRTTGDELWITPPREARQGLARVADGPVGDTGAVVFAQTFELAGTRAGAAGDGAAGDGSAGDGSGDGGSGDGDPSGGSAGDSAGDPVGDERTLRLLDATTGRETARATVPLESSLELVTRTTGYVAAPSASGRLSTMTAFDLSDGRRLWQLDDESRQFAFWDGVLTVTRPDGTVSRLVDPVRVAG